jgi:putative Mg2+ transporter-C (MgtC) family protein
MNVWIACGHLFVALAVGAMIGVERTYRGRAAGFRTYALVCVTSSMLMAATALPGEWAATGSQGLIMGDPTRVVQGIMTGIGFLGAGVIVKEGFSVRGLTTAASIWVTAAIGILIGSGLLTFGIVAALLTVGLLSAFRPLEDRMPTQHYLHVQIGFARDAILPESGLRELLSEHAFNLTELSYSLDTASECFTYEMILWTHSQDNVRTLAERLNSMNAIKTFHISPSRD